MNEIAWLVLKGQRICNVEKDVEKLVQRFYSCLDKSHNKAKTLSCLVAILHASVGTIVMLGGRVAAGVATQGQT